MLRDMDINLLQTFQKILIINLCLNGTWNSVSVDFILKHFLFSFPFLRTSNQVFKDLNILNCQLFGHNKGTCTNTI